MTFRSENDNNDKKGKDGKKSNNKPVMNINDLINQHIGNHIVGEDGETILFYSDFGDDYPEYDYEEDARVSELLYTTKDIIKYLNKYVIGQDEAKEELAVTVVNHLHACLWNMSDAVVRKGALPIKKQNLLIIGPSGTGKTYMISLVCKLLDLPYITVDATSLTAEGYVGKSVSSIIQDLAESSNMDIPSIERGVVYVDEVDKIAFKAPGSEGGRDIAGLEVQYGLLKLVEGVTERVQVQRRSIPVDTHNMLFVFSGAFTELREQKASKMNESSIGFMGEIKSEDDKVHYLDLDITIEDLIDYGMAPEFMGRIGKITETKPLTVEELTSIITDVKGGLLYSYKKLFELRGKKWPYKDDKRFARRVAKEAIDKGLGARGLYTIADKILHKHMLD